MTIETESLGRRAGMMPPWHLPWPGTLKVLHGKWGVGILLVIFAACPLAAEPQRLMISAEGVGGPGGYVSWFTQVSSPLNDRWTMWAGYQFLWEATGASNTPSVMVGGQFHDQALEVGGGAAITVRRGPDTYSSTTLALNGGMTIRRMFPSVDVPTWVEVQWAMTSSQSMTTSLVTATNNAGRLRRFGVSTVSSLFQTALGLNLRHPLSPSDSLHGMATVYVYNDSADRLAQLPSVALPNSGVWVPSLPVSHFGFGTSHVLFERWGLGWEFTRTIDAFESAPLDAFSVQGAWDITPQATARMSWTRVSGGAGVGNYLGLGGAVLF